MKKPNLQRLAQRSKIYLRKASPTILSGLGAAGVIVTSVLAVRATPKALRKIRADSKANHDGDPEAYSKLEAVKSAWVCYIPVAISGTATIFCIFGANVLNKHQQAALTSAYITADGICESTSLSFDERNPDDMRLFYDTFSRRYFESTIAQVLEAEYHLNRNWSLGGDVCVNDFYNFLGIEPIDGGDYLSWFYEDGISWIDFNHRKTVVEDGLEVYMVDIVYTPRMDDEPFA